MKNRTKKEQGIVDLDATSHGAGVTVQLSAITALQIAFSFAVQWVVVAHLGLGVQADALFAGYTLPQLIITLGADSLVFVLVPLLVSKSEQELEENGWQLFVGIGAAFSALTMLLYFATPVLTYLTVPGLSLAGKQLAITLAKIQVFSIVGAALGATLTAFYQVRHRFVWPALCVLVSSIFGLTLLIWKLPVYGVRLAAWVQLLINTVPAILLIPILGDVRRFKLDFDLLKQVFRRVRPIALGAAYYRTNSLVDRLLASFLAPGSIVILDMCQRIHNAIVRVLNQGIVTPVIPRLAKLAEQEKWIEFRTLIRKKALEMLATNSAILAVIIIAGLLARNVVSASILHHVFGNLGPGALTKLLMVFLYMSGVLFGSSLSHTFATAFYAEGDTVTPTKIGIVTYTVGLASKAAGFFMGGLTGIALAISFYTSLYAIALWYYLKPGKISAAEDCKRKLVQEMWAWIFLRSSLDSKDIVNPARKGSAEAG